MYTLYYSPGTASMVVHLALLEIGADYQMQLVDFDSKQQKSPAYLQLNPHGTVPTLLVDGQAYHESAALLMLLAERHPEARLAPPAGSPQRDQWRQWIVYLSNSLQSAYRFWFYPAELGQAEHTEAVRTALRNKIEGIFEQLEQHLSQHGPYLLGQQMSAADLYLTMLMRWSRNMSRPATSWPALQRLSTLMTSRPSWKKMSELEGLSGWPPAP